MSGGLFTVSQQIKEREDKNPDQIEKVPEEAANFDAVGKMFGIALVNFFADWQPHVNENENAAEHVQSVQSGDGEIAREIRAVRGQENRRALDILFLDVNDLV